MRLVFFLFILFSVSLSFLSLTVDNREANEDGLINPMLFLRHVFLAWSKNMNRTGDVIWKKYMKDVRQTYGKKNATMIKSVSKMAISLYQELPSSVKNEASGILASFRNGSLPLTVDSINGIIPKIILSIQGKDMFQFVALKDKIEKDFLPVAGTVFFNPFDQDNNDKLNNSDVISLFPGR